VDGYGVSLLLILAAIVVWFVAERRRRSQARAAEEAAARLERNSASTLPPIPSGSRLARLHELKEQGLITQEEHDERRREILREI
jgi:hypothetical protein